MMEQLLSELKAITGRVLDAHYADKIDLPSAPMFGLSFEEMLAVIHDDFIPTAELKMESAV